jgi:hypothetical protein
MLLLVDIASIPSLHHEAIVLFGWHSQNPHLKLISISNPCYCGDGD